MASISVAGDTSGSITISAPAVSGSNTLSLPAVTDTLAGIAATQTLTNKTLTSPVLTTPALGTPASGVLTNCTGVSVASVSGTLAVANGGTGVTTSTGSGANVLDTSPTLTTPSITQIKGPSSGTPTTFADSAGTATGTLCRAWVNFNPSATPPTVKGGFNVTSVTRNGTGDFTINFTNALPSINYAPAFSAVAQNSGAAYNLLTVGIYGTTGAVTTKTTTAIRITATYYNAASTVVNPVEMNASFFN